ncbi:hypothetical protein ABH19_12090 [Leptospirillum sp. Group II 'CF-1']|nr:hypothetical protein ABH19_12090 [Leptospirillum sp. Group II 'CF-1']
MSQKIFPDPDKPFWTVCHIKTSFRQCVSRIPIRFSGLFQFFRQFLSRIHENDIRQDRLHRPSKRRVVRAAQNNGIDFPINAQKGLQIFSGNQFGDGTFRHTLLDHRSEQRTSLTINTNSVCGHLSDDGRVGLTGNGPFRRQDSDRSRPGESAGRTGTGFKHTDDRNIGKFPGKFGKNLA